MSAINLNMQDGIVKSSLVSQIQERHVDVQRAENQAQSAHQHERERQANEVVKETSETEQDGIKKKEEREGNGKGDRRRRRKRPHEPGEEETARLMGPEDDGKPHQINIIA